MISAIRTNLLPACGHPMEYDRVKAMLWELAEVFPCVAVQTIGTTAGGKGIPAVTLGGSGDQPTVVYVGGINGEDWISTAILLRFITDYCLFSADGSRLYSVHLPYLQNYRRICVCPLLNCDGAVGAGKTGGDAGGRNAFGTDMMAAFRSMAGDGEIPPERYPECTALQQYVRFFTPSLFLSLQGNGEPVLAAGSRHVTRTGTLGRLLSRMSGCPFDRRAAASDDVTSASDWFTAETGSPAFLCGLGQQETEEGYLHGYATVREMLFSAPLLT